MIRTVEVIGDGGAFDTDKTNSSFLVNGSLLYDCGYNVFERLKEIDSERPGTIHNIKTVIISHMDDDHMGSIKSLLYYRYFILKQTTTVIGKSDVLSYLSGINKEMKGSAQVNAPVVVLVGYTSLSSTLKQRHGIMAYSFIGVHHTPVFGVIMYDEFSIVAISGDTKATSVFEDMIVNTKNMNSSIEDKNILVFHDYSYWDAPSRQVHACAGDWMIEYSESFRNKAYKYHNNKSNLEGSVFTVTKNGFEIKKEGV